MENRLRTMLAQTLEFARGEPAEACTIADRLECPTCFCEYPAAFGACPHDGALLVPLAEDALIGTRVGGSYKLVSVIGHGGGSVVYRAQHELIACLAAIKVFNLVPRARREEVIERFRLEACAVSSLDHPNIVTVYDFGVLEERQPYLIMEYVDGMSLSDLIEQEGFVPYDRALQIFSQICEAIGHAHGKRIVHRDLKPSNILLTLAGGVRDFVKVVDFGIAELLPWSEQQSLSTPYPGQLVGSPAYMSPEQVQNKAADARSDVYSLGAALYHALTGRPPFIARTIAEVFDMHVTRMPHAFKEVRADIYVPRRLEAAVFKALAKEPESRFQTMAEFREALEFAPRKPLSVSATQRERTGVLIVDDSHFIRQALKTVLQLEGDLQVVGEAEDGAGAVAMVAALQPDVVLMDIGMPGMDGIEATKQIKRQFPERRVIIFTASEAEEDILAAFRAGADGYALKSLTSGKVAAAIRLVKEGGDWLDPELSGRILHALAQATVGAGDMVSVVPEPRDKAEHGEALALISLAEAHEQNGRYAEAQHLYSASIALLKSMRGTDSDVADALARLAHIYFLQRKYAQAERFYLQCLEIRHKLLGPQHLDFASGLEELAHLFDSREAYAEAEEFYRWAVAVHREIAGSERSVSPAEALNEIAWVCRATKKNKIAGFFEARALELQTTDQSI